MGILEDYMRQQAEAQAQAQAQAKRDAILAMGMSLLGTRKGREMEGLSRAGLLGLGVARNTNVPQGPSLRDMLAMQQFQTQEQERAAAQAEQQAMRGAATASVVGGSPEMGPPTPAGGMQPATPGRFDPQQYAQRLYQMGRVNEAMAVEKQYAKPPKKLKDTRTLMQGGKRVTVNFYDDGTQEVLPFDPDAEKLHFADAGGTAGVGLDPFTGKPVSAGITKTMTPGERDSSARGWAGINLQKESAQRAEAAAAQPPKPEKPTDPQLAARGFLGRMTQAGAILDKLEDAGYTPSYGSSYVEGMKQIPMIGGTVGGLINRGANAVEPRMGLYNQAQRDWVRAKLRKESGAVIGKEEEEAEIRTYFPQAGDPPALITQKRAARKAAERAMATQGRVGADVEDDDPLGLRGGR